MSRFSKCKYDPDSKTAAVVGAGMTWDQVYIALDATGANVVGGRVPGLGVAGLVLGGGNDNLSFLRVLC